MLWNFSVAESEDISPYFKKHRLFYKNKLNKLWKLWHTFDNFLKNYVALNLHRVSDIVEEHG